MKFPVIEEIVLVSDNPQQFKKLVANVDNKYSPLVFNLLTLESAQGRGVNLIEEFIHEKNLSPNFPYPIYLLTSLKNYKGNLQILRTKKDVPKFFRIRDLKPNGKEESLISKSNMLSEKISNFSHQESTYKIFKFNEQHKKMYLQTIEGDYLEKLIKKLRKIK